MALLSAIALNLQTLCAQNTPVTAAEAEKLSVQLEQSVNQGDPEIFNHLIYFPEFIKRTESKSALINNYDTLTKIAGVFGLYTIGNTIVESSKNGNFSLFRSFTLHDETHLLFRSYGDGGFDYLDITLIKVKDTLRAADIYSYQIGESYARLFSYLISDEQVPDAHSSMTSREKYGKIFENAMRHKNYAAARSAFEKFDESTQNDRHFSLQYMIACQHLGEKQFRKSTDHYISLFADEPTPWLLMVQEYADTKNIDDYGHSIDKLDTLLQIDPFLNYFRGNVMLKLGDSRAAMHFYQDVFDYDPGIWQNTEKLVVCKVGNNELVQANAAITQYSHTPGYRKELVETLYADYPVLK
jgi:tetratricopeptide (TPR) repeat protein